MSHWVFDPISVACLLLSGALYVAGIWRLRARAGRGCGVRLWQIGAFAAGWVALVVALLSPVAAISEFLFSVHMTQHEMLILVAAPLLVLGRPIVPFLWAFTPRWRVRLGTWSRSRYWSAVWKTLTGPLLVCLLHGLALWGWHLPALYQAALGNAAIHATEHVCFLATACLFWWALIHGRYGRAGYGMAVAFVFVTGIHSGVLGALLTFAPRVWYPLYATRSSVAGFDPLEDQQLAGLIMWIPFGVIFLILGLALFAAWLGEAERRAKPASWIPFILLALVPLAAAGCESSAARHAEDITRGSADRGKKTIERYGCGAPQFLLVEFLHANTDVVREHEVEKGLLFALKRRADRNVGSRRAFLSGKAVSAVSFHRKRTAENYRRGYSLRSATLGSTAAALCAGK